MHRRETQSIQTTKVPAHNNADSLHATPLAHFSISRLPPTGRRIVTQLTSHSLSPSVSFSLSHTIHLTITEVPGAMNKSDCLHVRFIKWIYYYCTIRSVDRIGWDIRKFNQCMQNEQNRTKRPAKIRHVKATEGCRVLTRQSNKQQGDMQTRHRPRQPFLFVGRRPQTPPVCTHFNTHTSSLLWPLTESPPKSVGLRPRIE
mmetsp:Transcript_2634/g.5441  ORF Transcript_2634/g.5441 Transcript_2634/m.5441 type:complete len:201 (+) Transcript_2634:187-789(+)